jgi:hypothetical protein
MPSSTPPGPSGCMKITALCRPVGGGHLWQLVEGAVVDGVKEPLRDRLRGTHVSLLLS